MMLQSIVLGLMESVSPCALSILLFLLGFLFLTALRKNIIKNAISFIVALFVILFVFDAALIRLKFNFPCSSWFNRKEDFSPGFGGLWYSLFLFL